MDVGGAQLAKRGSMDRRTLNEIRRFLLRAESIMSNTEKTRLGLAAEVEEALDLPVTLGKSVLVVDDEEALLEMLSQVLESWDHQVETAVSGRSAIRMLEEKDYDLIITDYKMPDMGGRELYLWLKGWRSHLAGRVLLMTGDTASSETRAFLDETGLPHLVKPFSGREGKKVIYQILASGEADSA